MTPYRTSLSARILSGGAAVSLVAAGLVPVIGFDHTRAVPLIILFTIAVGLSGILVAIPRHGGAALWASMLLPLAMWPYVMVMSGIMQHYPSYGWALIAAAGVPVALFVASLGTRPETADQMVRENAVSAPR
jgi:hypothetical protein